MSKRVTDGIKIRVAQPHESERVLDFLRTHYYTEEPLTIGIQPIEQTKENERFDISNISHGTCLVALQSICPVGGCLPPEQGNIVGAVLAGPKKSNEAEQLFEEAALNSTNKWGQILQFLACVERDSKVYERYNVENALHAHVLCVDANLRGKKLGYRLLQSLARLGRILDYPLLTVDCTSHYSAQLVEKLGWDCVNIASYADHVGDDGEPVFQPPPPHFTCKTFAVPLHR